ncbi:unnamed protein product [Danaus chrysippus]|uniref:(African queen) hypothetical protein n=1 Tax=Danaus chrysippus TaxID=151541 RepID=A0A8J2RC34_9NEOP|nr:unnamed protein product [Danaus chrysippus]
MDRLVHLLTLSCNYIQHEGPSEPRPGPPGPQPAPAYTWSVGELFVARGFPTAGQRLRPLGSWWIDAYHRPERERGLRVMFVPVSGSLETHEHRNNERKLAGTDGAAGRTIVPGPVAFHT